MPFALDSNPDISEVSDAINYLLANFGPGLSADAGTGQITGPTGEVSGYLYKYMAIKYADSYDGSVNFSNVPASHTYYGIRNSNDTAESSDPADYIWYRVSGGFGGTKSLWYICTGGRQIQFAASVSAPDAGWLVDPGSSIDLDVVTSGNIPVIAETFFPYFTPNTLQVPRTSGGTPVFTNIIPVMYATDAGSVAPFTDAQTDSAVSFVNGTWRIGNSAITGNADISYTNITIGSPTDAGDYAQWPAPTAMSSSPAYITVPVRYKNSLGVVTQAGTATVQLVFVDPGANGLTSSTVDISGYTGFVQNAGGAFTPTTATLSAVLTNVTAPTYSWAITGATPTSATTASVVVTPTSSSTGVTASLTVNGSNLLSPITKSVTMPVAYNGAAGSAGANGVMSAFPTIYIWTGSSTPPTRPTTTSTYTWSTGAYTAPTSWSTTAPSNTTPGNYLWSITVPLNESATTATSTLDWTNVTYPIRGIAYNGTNGADGSSGVNGTRTAILDVYKWSTLAPTTFPVGSSTYTWATGQFTAPATLNGWSLTPPTAVLGQVLWIARTLYADNNTTATTTVTWTASQANPVGASGVDGATGATGATGANGARTAFLEVYQWAATAPTSYPSGNSTYTWADGSFTAPGTPNGWSLTPGSSTPGYTLYGCSVRYADTATTATTSVAWTTSTAYIVGYSGVNGATGATGAAGSNGAATYVITRTGGAGEPTPAEVYSLLGRYAVAGDICTVSYNSGSNAEVYRYVTAWALFQTYITGSLIVQNTITSDKLSVNQLSAISANLGTITAGDLSIGSNPSINGSTMTGTGSHLYSNGNFAMGTSSKNFVFNGTDVYLNGFTDTVTSQTNLGNVLQNYPNEILNFNVTKTSTAMLFVQTAIGIYTADLSVFAVQNFVSFRLYKIVLANEMTIGTNYYIRNSGTTNFTLYGAANNNIGTYFTATAVGVGTGTLFSNSQIINNTVFSTVQATPNFLSYKAVEYPVSYGNAISVSPSSAGYALTVNKESIGVGPITFLNSSGSVISSTPAHDVYYSYATGYSYVAKI